MAGSLWMAMTTDQEEDIEVKMDAEQIHHAVAVETVEEKEWEHVEEDAKPAAKN